MGNPKGWRMTKDWCYTHDVPKEIRSDRGWQILCPHGCPNITMEEFLERLKAMFPEDE